MPIKIRIVPPSIFDFFSSFSPAFLPMERPAMQITKVTRAMIKELQVAFAGL